MGFCVQIFLGCLLASGAFGAFQHVPQLPAQSRTQYSLQKPDGTFVFGYDTGDGQYHKAQADNAGGVVGEFGYQAPNGDFLKLDYVADKDGFRPRGSHLPVPPAAGPSTAGTYAAQGGGRQDSAVFGRQSVAIGAAPSRSQDGSSFRYDVDNNKVSVQAAQGSYSFDAAKQSAGYSYAAPQVQQPASTYVPPPQSTYIPPAPQTTYIPSTYSPAPSSTYGPPSTSGGANQRINSLSAQTPVSSYSYDANQNGAVKVNVNSPASSYAYSFNAPSSGYSQGSSGYSGGFGSRPYSPGANGGSSGYSGSSSSSYNPREDPYYDENADRSYRFEFDTDTYDRRESADSQGNVVGSFSYIGLDGQTHSRSYKAGSGTGFIADGNDIPREGAAPQQPQVPHISTNLSPPSYSSYSAPPPAVPLGRSAAPVAGGPPSTITYTDNNSNTFTLLPVAENHKFGYIFKTTY